MATKTRILIGYEGSACTEATVCHLLRAGLPEQAEMAEAFATAARGVDRGAGGVAGVAGAPRDHAGLPARTARWSGRPRSGARTCWRWLPRALGGGEGRALLVSISQQVLSDTICSVRVARFREDETRVTGNPMRVVLAIDGSIDSAPSPTAPGARWKW